MSFKNLSSILKKKDSGNISEPCADAYTACDVLEWFISQINESLYRERSEVKLNMFEKGAVGSGLNMVIPGTIKYLKGMRPEELNVLLDGIEERLIKRSKNMNIQQLMAENFRLRKELNDAMQKLNQ